jgi:hypothetical protein
MTMPNFLVIGVEKAGTTALYYALSQHPQIYMSPVKEPCFFAFENQNLHYQGPGDDWINMNAVPVLKDYQALFDGRKNEVAVGEASTYYMMSGLDSAASIMRHIPDVKLILVLRQPVERAYSAFTAMVSYGREKLRDFPQAIASGKTRWQNHWEPAWRYFENSFYASQLLKYFTYFDKAQTRIYLYEDWNLSPLAVLQDIFTFLEVDTKYLPDKTTRHNVSNYPLNDKLFKFLTSPNRMKSLGKLLLPQKVRKFAKQKLIYRNWTVPPVLDTQTRSHLIERYRPDILQVQDIIGRNLQSWLAI